MSLLLNALKEEAIVNQDQVTAIRAKHYSAQSTLHDLLLDMDLVREDALLTLEAKLLEIPFVDLYKDMVDPSVTKLLKYEIAQRYGVCPITYKNGTLTVAVNDPFNISVLDDLRFITDFKIKPVLAMRSEIQKCLHKCYRQLQETINKCENELIKKDENGIKIEKLDENNDPDYDSREIFDIEQLSEKNSGVVKLSNSILSDAVKARATDIHIEPHETFVDIRYRIDGALKSVIKISNNFRASLIARLKILTELDITETRQPQDGRTRIMVNGTKIDLRISIIPTFHGEKAVVRLLYTQSSTMDIEKVGFKTSEMSAFLESVSKPQGIVLVTGPTGSGKTTTLYAALKFLMQSDMKNIVTIEDPIEYLIEGINQMQVNLPKDLTFANGLRAILRQDPNVILVGEIRDKETAEIAFRASLTGHLVFSTLHTNSAVATVTRLLDIGLQPYLLASSISLIIAQRLIRLICPHCKEEHTPKNYLTYKFGKFINDYNVKKFYKGKGCDDCNFTGYLGRAAVFEVLKVNERIRSLINRKAAIDTIYNEAIANGMQSLLESGMEKIAAGQTTLEEIERVADVISFSASKEHHENSEKAIKRTELDFTRHKIPATR
ncbi:MAG: type II/IV secretion system protein [Candidatus Omnitrophica bacterium]|nr:type II/IV secretion system protein [Candidatus Omnitrophota bacterium]